MEETQTIQLDLTKVTKRSLIYSNPALGISNLKVPKPLMDSEAPAKIGVTFEVPSDAMSVESPIEELRSKLVGRLQKDRELRGRIRKLEKICQHEWVIKEGKEGERCCLLCGKKDKIQQGSNFARCEICFETKHLTSDVDVKGWWAVHKKKDGGASFRPIKAGGLKPGERAACGTGHLMILCERVASSGSLDKTVWPDKKAAVVEGTTPNGEVKPPAESPKVEEPKLAEPLKSEEPLIQEGELKSAAIIDDIPPDPN